MSKTTTMVRIKKKTKKELESVFPNVKMPELLDVATRPFINLGRLENIIYGRRRN